MSNGATINSNQGYAGFADNTTAHNDTNALSFVVKQHLAKMQTAMPCKVIAVTNNGEVKECGTLTLQPMVHQIDGAGNVVPHGNIYNVPYHRQGGGTNGIIADPKVGDVGIVSFASRDMSTVKKTRDVAAPASWRRNDWADAMYHGQILNVTPTQYIQFTDDGITVYSPGTVTITGKGDNGVAINGPKITITADNEVTITAPAININDS